MDEMEWEAVTPEGLADLLEMADRVLAERQLPVSERPLAALIQLVHWQLVAGPDGQPIPLDGASIAKDEVFRPLGKMIGQWYHQHYGKSKMSPASDKLAGFVLVRMSPFLIGVPSTITERGDVPDTAWLHFTDSVSPHEDVLEWLVDRPVLDGLHDLESLRQEITAVASDLRFIYTASIAILSGDDEQLLAFVRGVRSHLDQAARRVVNQRTQDVAESYWEMQMAAEVALKALLLQRTGTFPYIHSLRGLLKSVSGFDPSFTAAMLKDFPEDHETIRRRYGTGTVSWKDAYGHYRVILVLVRSAMERMKRAGLSGASICIRKAPWAIG